MAGIQSSEEKSKEVSGKLVKPSDYGMEEIELYDDPRERLRKRYEYIDFRFGDGVLKRDKAYKIRPDLCRKLDELYDLADSEFVRLFIDQIWFNNLENLWVQYENKVLYPMCKVLAEMGGL